MGVDKMSNAKNTDINISARNYSLDLLRIISMLGIIGLHMMNAGGMLSAAKELNYVMAKGIATLMYCSVNIFAMLTGYLYVSKVKITSVSVVKLLIVVFFYCVVITASFFIGFNEIFVSDKQLIIFSLFPMLAGRYWYITAYILMFFMIPYINVLLKTISKETFRKMLGILFVLLSVVTTFGLRDYFKVNNGYSPFWLIFCYLTGAYIKLHGVFKDFSQLKKIILLMINVFLILLVEVIFVKLIKHPVSFHEYTSPFSYINAIIILEIFLEIKLNKVAKKIVLSLSASSFGVYIVHSHILIYDNVISGNLKWFGDVSPVLWLIYFVLINIGIYLFCHICELIRGFIFKLLHVEKFANNIGDKLDINLGWNNKVEKM